MKLYMNRKDIMDAVFQGFSNQTYSFCGFGDGESNPIVLLGVCLMTIPLFSDQLVALLCPDQE
jgi:hypothetical protein